MYRYEDFPKKCLKCKRSDLPLERFQIGYLKSETLQGSFTSRVESKAYSGYSIRIPLCRRCKKQFKTYLKLRLVCRILGLLTLFALFLTLLFTFIPPPISFPFNLLPFIVMLIPTILFLIIFTLYPYKIQDYIELTENGVFIKDRDYNEEVNDYMKLKIVQDELNINKKPCSNCGALIRIDADFCLSCGKDLR